jgi:transcriptional regulator with XRE-family HTH domain
MCKEGRMISDQEALIRNKITGVLLRTARLRAGREIAECAATLSRDPAFFERAEEGQEALSLPQLESLALFLNVPVQYLIGEQELPTAQVPSDPAYYEERMKLQHRIVGVILQQARAQSGRTLADVASSLGWEPERLAQAEWGEESIPLVELQALAAELGIPFDTFVDQREPSPPQGRPREVSPHAAAQLSHLSAELRAFIAKPINVPYLQVALNLSQMPAQVLRQLASGLFEITY